MSADLDLMQSIGVIDTLDAVCLSEAIQTVIDGGAGQAVGVNEVDVGGLWTRIETDDVPFHLEGAYAGYIVLHIIERMVISQK